MKKLIIKLFTFLDKKFHPNRMKYVDYEIDILLHKIR